MFTTIYPVRKVGASMSGINWLVIILLAQRGHMFAWVPVCLATGIGIYFSLRFEPILPLYFGVGLEGIIGMFIGRFLHEAFALFFFGICLMCVGFSVAAIRTHLL